MVRSANDNNHPAHEEDEAPQGSDEPKALWGWVEWVLGKRRRGESHEVANDR